MKNMNFGKLNEDCAIEYAPIEVTVDGKICINPSAEHYAACGYWPIVDVHPTPVEGKHEEGPTIELVEVQHTSAVQTHITTYEIRRTWTLVDDVPPVAAYKVEDVIYALIEFGALQSVKQVVGDYWELFTMRDTISADNEIWTAKLPELKAAIVAAGALTDEQFDAVLEAAKEV